MRDFLKLTAWFIAVRLAKGVAMAFVLIIFTMQFNNHEPDFAFVIVTFLYFIVTQKKWTGNETIISWVRQLQFDFLEEEEDYWIPFFIKGLPLVASLAAEITLMTRLWWLSLLALYTNVIVPVSALKNEFDERYHSSAISVLWFRKASNKELEDHPTCPVCLDHLRVARVTPCNHLYHATCLKKCLAVTRLCPLCKHDVLA